MGVAFPGLCETWGARRVVVARRFVVSHPSRKKRGKDGKPGQLVENRTQELKPWSFLAVFGTTKQLAEKLTAGKVLRQGTSLLVP